MSRAEFIPPPRDLHRADDLSLRAGLASFLVHGLLIGLLVAGGLYYKRFPFLLTHTAEPPPTQMNLVPIVLPPPEPVPIPPPLPIVPPKPIAPAAKPKPKTAVRKSKPAVAHVHKAPPPAPPLPIAHAVPAKESPRALPVPPVPIPKIVSPKTPAKVPLKALPVLAPPPPPIAQALHAKTPPKALPVAAPAPVEKPAPIPVLPAMPPPRAVAVAPPAPAPVPVLPAMPPPRAVAVAPPAPEPAPPQPEVAPAPAPEPVDPGPPPSLLAKPDFVLIEGPDKTDFPQPNYPWAARSRGLTGTVLMNVQFDERGRVIFAEVAKSSGVTILDTATRSFILTRWHLPMYAGKAVSVPIVYQMETR